MIERPTQGRDPGSAHDASQRPAATPARHLTRIYALPVAWLVATAILFGVAGLAVARVSRTGVPVTVVVDGYSEMLRSTRTDVGGLLLDLGLDLRSADALTPTSATPLRPGLVVTVTRARAALIDVDGGTQAIYSRAVTVGELVAAAGIRLAEADEIWQDGVLIPATAPVPAAQPAPAAPRYARARAWVGKEPAPIRLSIRRAVPIIVDDGSVPYTIFTTAATIGEALTREQVTLYLGDRVQPSPGSRVSAGVRVFIERSMPVFVTADGRTTHTRTRGKTVGGTLMDLGITVTGADRVIPALDQPIVDQQQIRVVRRTDVTLVERRPIPYEAIMVPDDNLEIDQQRLAQAGKNGEYRKRWRVIYEDGVEVSRVLLDEWTAAQPVTRRVAYGRKIVSRQLDTPDGPVSYWRKIRMYATSYSPARSGTPKSAPWYGRTRIGLQLRTGIVAVDPNVVALRSWVYVPSYGKAIAGDTGGGVRGKWIDVGYDDVSYISWHWWTDVYLLDPPPPASKIMWVLPNYPPAGFPYRR